MSLVLRAQDLMSGLSVSASFEVSDLRPETPPPGTWGPRVRYTAAKVMAPEKGEAQLGERLVAILFLAATDADLSGTLEADEWTIQGAVGNLNLVDPQPPHTWSVKLINEEAPLVTRAAPFVSYGGAVCTLEFGTLPYAARKPWEARVRAGGPEVPPELQDAWEAVLAAAQVSPALKNTHTSGGSDLTVGRHPVAAALVEVPAERPRLLAELRQRRDDEALRPTHFVVLGEKGPSSWRPYSSVRDGGDLWEKGFTKSRYGVAGDPWGWSKLLGSSSPWGGYDPEHFTRCTDELYVLAMATGDPLACWLLRGPVEAILGWKEWNPDLSPAYRPAPLSPRMIGWVLMGQRQAFELHGDAYRPGLEAALLDAIRHSGAAPSGVPYSVTTHAIAGHGAPTFEQLVWYVTDYEEGPKLEWDPAWTAWLDATGKEVWELWYGDSPLRAALQDAGELAHGQLWAFIDSGLLEENAPKGADPNLYGIAIKQFFSACCVWQSAVELIAVLAAWEVLAEADGLDGVPAIAWEGRDLRDLAKHLAWLLLVGRNGFGPLPPAWASPSQTLYRDLQLRGGAAEEEPAPFATLDGYDAEALAYAHRMLPAAGEGLRGAMAATAGMVVDLSKGAWLGDPARLPDTFWESRRLAGLK